MDSEVVESAEISALIVHWCSHAVAAWPRWVYPSRGRGMPHILTFQVIGRVVSRKIARMLTDDRTTVVLDQPLMHCDPKPRFLDYSRSMSIISFLRDAQ